MVEIFLLCVNKIIIKIIAGGYDENLCENVQHYQELVELAKKLKVSEEEQDAWIQDQYSHPQESLHTIDEVLDWFDKNNIEFISSIPSCDFETPDNYDLFTKQSRGNYLTRFLKQITMIFNNLGSDGGLFVLIGKKR
mgnify:CR=1 FL=1